MLTSRFICALSLATLQFAVAAEPSSPPPRTAGAVIAYVFAKDRALAPDEVAGEKLTRINYAFANVRDGEVVEGFSHDRENFRTLVALKARNPQLQVLVSVGGWTWSGAFSDAALTKESRRKFVESAVRFVETNNLDGVDIDWEYPGMPGMGNTNRPEDRQNYTSLLKDMRKAFDRLEKKLGRKLYTSVATAGSTEFLAHTQIKEVAHSVDTVNLMAYDYYEPDDDKTTGHHAPLFTDLADPKHVSADASVKLYLAAGVPANKLVLGVPFYGHAWAEVPDVNHGLFQPGKKTDLNADYNQVVATLLKNGYTRFWDVTASAPYLYNPATRTFVSYEDVESIGLKCQYVLKHKLAGVMFWEYAGDSDGALLNAINTGLHP